MDGKTKLKKGDLVQVISGKDRAASRRGKVLAINHENGRVKVEGVNMVRRAQKPRRSNEKGQFIDLEAELSISNVMLVCHRCGPVRSGHRFGETGSKLRFCRKCKEVL